MSSWAKQGAIFCVLGLVFFGLYYLEPVPTTVSGATLREALDTSQPSVVEIVCESVTGYQRAGPPLRSPCPPDAELKRWTHGMRHAVQVVRPYRWEALWSRAGFTVLMLLITVILALAMGRSIGDSQARMRVIFFGSCLFLVASAKPLVNTWRKRPVFPQNAEAQMAQGLSAGQVNALKIRVSTLTARFTVPDSQRETVMTVNTVSRRRFRVDVPALDALHLVARPVDLKTMIVAIGVTLLNLWMIGLFGWTALRTARERRPNASD